VTSEIGSAAHQTPITGLRRWAATKWLLGALLFLDVGVLLVVLSLSNVTSEGPAKRSLGHSLAILTEVDTLLDARYDTLRQEAAQTNGDITLNDVPISVSFTSEEILNTDREQFRALLLQRWADQVYDQGVGILHEDRASEVRAFSTQGLVRTGMDFLRPTPHKVLGILTIVFAVLAAAFAAGLVLTTRGYGRLGALGLSVFLASIPFLIAAVAVRFIFRLGADGVDEYFVHEFLRLGQEITWAAIRNGMIFSIGSGAVMLAGAALARWSDARLRP
jgi:hypothetical protein